MAGSGIRFPIFINIRDGKMDGLGNMSKQIICGTGQNGSGWVGLGQSTLSPKRNYKVSVPNMIAIMTSLLAP